MYNFKHIEYDPFWYKQVAKEYEIQKPAGISSPNTEKIAKQAYSYTTNGYTKYDPLVFSDGYGPFLKDVDNNIFLDFGSGIYTANLGHAHPKVAEAISIEAKKLISCHDHITPVKLAYFEKLIEACGNKYSNVHLYDNGSTAVEISIKAARQITGKMDIISCFSDHHGKTLGAASVGRVSHMKDFQRAPNFYMVPRPDPYHPIWINNNGSLDIDSYINFYDLFIKESTSGQVAAFLLEPIQGWKGTVVPPDDFFPKLKEFCVEKNILLISDEVLTGCGRTGKWLCLDHWGVKSDITLLGKGIGNGFPMSAMLADGDYAESISNIGPSSTYGGNPLACAAGLATLEIFEDESVTENSDTIGKYLLASLNQLKDEYKIIGDVRGKGCILAIEFVKNGELKEPYIDACDLFYKECLKRKLIPGIPVVNLIRIAPPLIINKELADIAVAIIDKCLRVVTKKLS